jgi:uncharacterized protein (TIGR03382 family)
MRPSLPARFATLGGTIGCIVASGLMPDGCAIHEADSVRLRVGVPLWFPLVLLALGWLVRRRRRLPAIVALPLAAATALAAGTSLIYRGSLEHIGGAFMVLLPALGLLVPALPWATWAAHRGQAARPGTPARALAGLAGPILAAAAGLIGALAWGLDRRPLDLRLALAGASGCVVLAALAWRDLAALARAESALRRALPPPAIVVVGDVALPEGAAVLDAGVGHIVRQAPGSPYRSPSAIWLGDHEGALVKVRRARRAGVGLLALALVASAVAALAAVVPDRPPPRSPDDAPVPSLHGGC